MLKTGLNLIALSLTFVTATMPAVHAEVPESSPWSFGVEALTDFPVQVGGGLYAETPQRIQLRMSVGVMTAAYLYAVNALAQGAGWYNQVTADLISDALES